MMKSGSTPHHKAVASIILLVTWDLWSERNVRVFHHKHVPHLVIQDKIKSETHLWVTVEAKRLGEIMLEE
jgi:hypothetical protein